MWDLRGPPPRRSGSVTRKIGTHQHFVWLYWVVGATLILNLCDAVLTLFWVYTGQATEANPLLAELVTQHPVMFVTVKTLLVVMGSLLLWRHRKRPLAVVAIFVAFMVYYMLLLYHLRAVNVRLLERILM